MNIRAKFFLSILSVTALVIVGSSIATYNSYKKELTERAEGQKAIAVSSILNTLDVTNNIVAERVQSSMAQLKLDGLALGSPRLGDTVSVGQRTVPQLYFGNIPQANNFELVDTLTEKMGGTATLFVKSGQDFVRVATNVKKEGVRATGTVLNQQGAAYKRIQNGQSFFGQIDILGSPYITGYSPIFNDSGEVIGIWYVGYSADLTSLQQSISEMKVLNRGFVALMDSEGRLRMHTRNDRVNAEMVEAALEDQSGEWQLQTSRYEPWRYSVVAGTSVGEVRDMIFDETASVALLISLSGITILLAVGAGLKIIIHRPIMQMMDTITDLAEGKGDLTVRFESESKDEFGAMANGFDRVLAKIQATMQEVSDLSKELSAASTQIASGSQESLQALERQGQSTEQAATSVHQMSVTAQAVSESAVNAEEAAKNGDLQVQEGHRILNVTVEKIAEQSEAVAACRESVTELRGHANRIESVLDIINEIAEQTNLLALNAAIEAARAGEYGRGFSVVADEVRGLARRTQDAINDTREKIESLQGNSESMDQRMEATYNLSGLISEAAYECQDSMNKIASAIATITEQNTDIASAAEEQSQVSDEVSKTIESINSDSQRNTRVAQENSKASGEMDGLANRLERELGKYKIW